jgi:D-inositol-3-phosphate glycosyltransferase
VSGVRDLLESGVNGWFVDRDRDDIAARLAQLSADPALGQRMGEAARLAAAGFSWDEMVSSYAELYESLAG